MHLPVRQLNYNRLFLQSFKDYCVLSCILSLDRRSEHKINKQYRSTMTGLLLPNTISQKDTTIPQIKIKITKIPLEKKLNTALPQSPPPQHE